MTGQYDIHDANAALADERESMGILDFQNPHNHHAITLRTGDPEPHLLGYLPDYLVDVLGTLREHNLEFGFQDHEAELPWLLRELANLSLSLGSQYGSQLNQPAGRAPGAWRTFP